MDAELVGLVERNLAEPHRAQLGDERAAHVGDGV
jgi:hypothetical protein